MPQSDYEILLRTEDSKVGLSLFRVQLCIVKVRVIMFEDPPEQEEQSLFINVSILFNVKKVPRFFSIFL